jgi:hypothetical protein
MDVRDAVIRLPAEANSCPRADRQTVTGALPITCSLFPGIERRGLEAGYSHSNAEIKHEWRCISTTPYGFMLRTWTTYLCLLRNYITVVISTLVCSRQSSKRPIRVCGTLCIDRGNDIEVVVLLAYGTAQCGMWLPSGWEGHAGRIFTVILQRSLKQFLFEMSVTAHQVHSATAHSSQMSLVTSSDISNLRSVQQTPSPADEVRPHSKRGDGSESQFGFPRKGAAWAASLRCLRNVAA